ncbi:MAG: OmpA family protein [Polyangiaceae bacterium]
MKSSLRSLVLGALGAGLALAAVGCGGSEPKPPVTQATTPVGHTETTASPKPRKSDQVINLSEDIRKACNIDDTDRAPKFDFDSTALSSNDRDLLQKLGTCLTTGPLKGRSIKLVGRTDPRGESEYNMNLGGARAGNVRDFLKALGLDAAHMAETSRGALDATGHDEEGWRKDRRVDVSLSN